MLGLNSNTDLFTISFYFGPIYRICVNGDKILFSYLNHV